MPAAAIESDLLSRNEAAAMLDIHVRTLDRLILYGRLPCVRIGVGGRTVKVARNDVAKYIADRRTN